MNIRQMDTRQVSANGERATARRLPETGAHSERAITARAERSRWQTVPLAIVVAALAVLFAVVVSDGHPLAWFSAFAVIPLAVGIVLRSWYWPLASSVIVIVLTAILIAVVLAPLVLDQPNADPDVIVLAFIVGVEGAVAAVLAAAGALIGTIIGRRRSGQT